MSRADGFITPPPGLLPEQPESDAPAQVSEAPNSDSRSAAADDRPASSRGETTEKYPAFVPRNPGMPVVAPASTAPAAPGPAGVEPSAVSDLPGELTLSSLTRTTVARPVPSEPADALPANALPADAVSKDARPANAMPPAPGPGSAGHDGLTTSPSWMLVGEDGVPLRIAQLTVVGRNPSPPDSDHSAELYSIDDPQKSVSKTHALLTPSVDGLTVTDLYSTNGVAVETASAGLIVAEPGVPLAVPDGATIEFGRMRFRVERA